MSEQKTGDLKDRTYNFSLQVVELYKSLNDETLAQELGKKLLNSGTLVGSTTRPAFRGRNNQNFVDKLKLIIKEADECIFWIDLLIDSKVIVEEDGIALISEASEIIAIFISIIKKNKQQHYNN